MEIPLFICVFSFSHEKKNNTAINRQPESNFFVIHVFVWFLKFYSKKYTEFVDNVMDCLLFNFRLNFWIFYQLL